MSIIKLRCTDQVLTFENTPVIASGGLEEDFIEFDFCSQWDGFERTAVFWRTEDEVYHVMLDENNSCHVPPEVTADDGTIFFGVFGVDPAGRQRTTEVLTYRIVKGAITTGTKPSEPTPDIYTQLIAKYDQMVDIAVDTRAKEQAFENAMTQRQVAFEQAINADQGAFKEATNEAMAKFEQEIRMSVSEGMIPDGTVTEKKLDTNLRFRIETVEVAADDATALAMAANSAATTAKDAAELAQRTAGGAQNLADEAKDLAYGAVQASFEAVEALETRARIETGSYVGTGGYGEGAARKLTFNFTPKLVIVMPGTGGSDYFNPYGTIGMIQEIVFPMVLVRGVTKMTNHGNWAAGYNTSTSSMEQTIEWGENYVQWYSQYKYTYAGETMYAGSAAVQRNISGVTYHYIAFG